MNSIIFIFSTLLFQNAYCLEEEQKDQYFKSFSKIQKVQSFDSKTKIIYKKLPSKIIKINEKPI
mgnify:CR=1 FL=1